MLLSISLIIAACCLLFVWLRRYLRGNGNAPPTPPGWPVIGNVLDMDLTKPHQSLTSWGDDFPDLFNINLCGTQVLVLNSYEAIHQALVKKSDDFAGRPYMFRMRYVLNDDEITFTSLSSKWLAIKDLATRALSCSHRGMPIVDRICTGLVSRLVTKLHTAAQEPLDTLDDLHMTTSGVLSCMIYGRELDDADLRQLVDLDDTIRQLAAPDGPGGELDMFPWLRYFMNKSFQRLRKFKDMMDFWFRERLHETYTNDNIPKCLLEMMMKERDLLKDENGNHLLSRDVIDMITRDFLFAGMQTTSRALYCFVALMVAHPGIQSRVQKDLDKTLGSRPPKVSDKSSLPYLESLLLEVLRYISHVPIAIPHETTRDTTIMGYDIPQGTQTWCNIWSLHHNEAYWKEPWEFIPDRFLDDQGKLLPADSDLRQKLLPYGAGRRVCVAERMGNDLLFIMAASMLQHMTFVPEAEDKLPECDPRGYELGLVLQIPRFKVRTIPRTGLKVNQP